MATAEQIERSWRAWLVEVSAAVLEAMLVAVAAALDAALSAVRRAESIPDPAAAAHEAQQAWDEHEDDIVEVLVVHYEATAEASARALLEDAGDAREPDLVAEAAQYARDARNRLTGVTDDVHAAVSRVIADGIAESHSLEQVRRDIAAVLQIDRWDRRVEAVARTETHAAMSRAQQEGMVYAAGVTGSPARRQWLATVTDQRTRPTHRAAHLQERGLHEPYTVGSASLEFPGDPAGPPEEVVLCRCASVPVVGGRLIQARWGEVPTEMVAAVDAAEEARKGAMIALVPADADAARLAVPGGLPPDDLHLTLVDLGEGVAWPNLARATLRANLEELLFEPAEGEVFGHASFNPTGDSACVVYIVGDDSGALSAMRERAWAVARDVAGLMLPEQHDPWVAHVTAGYGLPLDAVSYTGGVLFDRLRVSYGGDVRDYPLQPLGVDCVDCEPTSVSEPEEGLTAGVALAAPPPALTDELAGTDPVEVSALAALIASIPESPPRSWFERRLDRPTPITLTADGHVYGHLALWSTCHDGMPDSCVRPPKSRTAYRCYHTGATLLADGSTIPTGRITVGGGHAGYGLSPESTLEHYDNAGSVVASVRARDDDWGVALSGALMPGVTPDQVSRLLSAPLSGDWRAERGHLELRAALAVVVPGFPVHRDVERADDGTVVTLQLTASSLVQLDTDDPAPPGGDVGAEQARRAAAVDAIGAARRAAVIRDLDGYAHRSMDPTG